MMEMFEYAEKSGKVEGNDNMKLLWQCQKEALESGDPRQQ